MTRLACALAACVGGLGLGCGLGLLVLSFDDTAGAERTVILLVLLFGLFVWLSRGLAALERGRP